MSVRLGGHVGETAEKFRDGGLAVFDGGALIVGEGNVDQHPLQVVLGLDELAGGGSAGGDGVAVDQDLDGAHVTGEVAGVAVGAGQRVRGDLRVELGGLR